jgi:hypothetical protein
MSRLSKHSHQMIAAVVLLLVSVAVSAQSCPNPPVVPTNFSPQTPTDVCVPDGFPGNPIAFFDDYSWRTFIAMVWPAAQNQRGMPDSNKKIGDTSGPLVFETLKQDWEIFQPNGNAPSANWNDFEQNNPCKLQSVGFNDFLLASFSEFGNLGEAGFGNLTHALPAQNKTWVRYATAFNQSEFNEIVSNQFYLRSKLPAAGIAFQDGAIDVKSSWIEMTNIPHPERYYTRKAWLKDPVTGLCSAQPIMVGLVGLHIVQKTPTRPQWIWTTFEQVDNVPGPNSAPGSKFAFNDGTGASMPGSDPNQGFPPSNWAAPIVYNVQRKKPIHPSTQQTNAAYQKAVGGVWQFYQLVMTQWPLDVNQPTVPGTPTHTFPGTGATTSFANTTLETWDQNSIGTGCMACHTQTQKNTDFLWTLQVNAFPALAPVNAFVVAQRPTVAVKNLESVLASGEAANKPAKSKKPVAKAPNK